MGGLDPHPVAILDAVFSRCLGMNGHKRPRMELAHGFQLTVLGVEELVGPSTRRGDERVLCQLLGRGYWAILRLNVVGHRIDSPMVVPPAPELETTRCRVEARLAVGTTHALLVLVVLGIPRIVLVAAALLQLLEVTLVARAALGVLVGEVPRGQLPVVFPGPVLGLQPATQIEDDLLIGLCFVVARALGDGPGGRPPGAHGVALAAHGNRQHDIGMSHGGRRHIGVGHHAVGYLVHGLVHARCVHARAGERVGTLQPDNLGHEGLACLHGVQ